MRKIRVLAGREGRLAGNGGSEWMQMGNVTTAPVFLRHVSHNCLLYFVLSLHNCALQSLYNCA